MSKKLSLLVILLGVAVAFTGCKSKNESNGDRYLKEGRYRNAVNSYTNALQKGKVSKDFYDNFVVAYISAAKQTAKKNASDDLIRSYAEQIFKNMPNVKNKAAIDSVVQGLSEIGLAQINGDFEYEYTLQGFRNLDSAISIAKKNGASANFAEATRKKAEDALVKRVLESAEGAGNDITTEYVLLEAEVVAPGNADLKKALNKIRLKTRDTFLIFAEEIIGQRASRLVDKYGYVIAFPNISISSTGTTGEVSIWNSTGNNVAFEPGLLKLVSKTGESVSAKYTGGGWCGMDGVVGGQYKESRNPFKGSTGELRTEKTCNAKISFAYSKGFEPDYVDYRDKDNNIGRKYLGYK